MYCNYASGQSEFNKPYVTGTPCTNCSTGMCSNNLCGCSKVCLNFGTLDTLSCTCICPMYAFGEFCEKLSCNLTDIQLGCWGPGDGDYCNYSDAIAACPFTCGVCQVKLV